MTPEFIAPIVNFTVVAFIVFWFGRKPVLEFLANRSNQVAVAIAEGEKLSAEAEKSLTEWETNWKSLEAHAARANEDAKSAMKRFRENTLAAANGEAERIQKDAKLVAQGEALKAKQQLGRELVEKSMRMATQYLKSHVEDTDRKRLASEYVDQVGTVMNGKA